MFIFFLNFQIFFVFFTVLWLLFCFFLWVFFLFAIFLWLFFYKNITWKLLVNLPFLSHMLPYSVMFSFFVVSFLKSVFISFFFLHLIVHLILESTLFIFHALKIVFNGSLCQLANACLFIYFWRGCVSFLSANAKRR